MQGVGRRRALLGECLSPLAVISTSALIITVICYEFLSHCPGAIQLLSAVHRGISFAVEILILLGYEGLLIAIWLPIPSLRSLLGTTRERTDAGLGSDLRGGVVVGSICCEKRGPGLVLGGW